MDKRRSQSIGKLNSGIYILEIIAGKSFSVEIKKFEGKIFPTGFYYYVGSAQKNLSHRLARHIRKDKKVHWHIDHITVQNINKINRIFLFENAPKEMECRLANFMEAELQLNSTFKGFGNSDSNCSSTHLFYSKSKIDYNHFFSLYQSMVLLSPSSIDIS